MSSELQLQYYIVFEFPFRITIPAWHCLVYRHAEASKIASARPPLLKHFFLLHRNRGFKALQVPQAVAFEPVSLRKHARQGPKWKAVETQVPVTYRVVADVWEEVWDFLGQVWELRFLPRFRHFLGRITVQKYLGKRLQVPDILLPDIRDQPNLGKKRAHELWNT